MHIIRPSCLALAQHLLTPQDNFTDHVRPIKPLMEDTGIRERFDPQEQYGNNLGRKPSQMILNRRYSNALFPRWFVTR
jgi:hypothetical protein